MNMNLPNISCLILTVTFSCCLVGSDVNLGVLEVPSFYNLCPFTEFCRNNATKNFQGNLITPCCGYCSCAGDCWKRGNCCPDKEDTLRKEPLESCETSLRSSGNTSDTGTGEPHYYVVTTCQNRAADKLAQKCRGELLSTFDDLIWVTDRRTNIIFKNKYCAICHGVEDYNPWTMETNCMKAMNGQTPLKDVVRQILDECSVTVVPPKNEDHTDKVCMIPNITNCNITGEWEAYDQAMESACSSFTQIYIQESRDGSSKVVYGNIYCYLCNSPNDRIVRNLCTTEAKLLTTTLPDFKGILDFREIERVMEIGEHHESERGPVCTFDAIKDPFQGRCLNVSCPLLHAPIYGNCVKLVSSTRSLGVSAMLFIYPLWNSTSLKFVGTRKHQKNIAKSLLNSILHGLGLPRNCESCTNIIMVNDHSGNISSKARNPQPKFFPFYALFKTNNGCPEDIIVEHIYRLLGKEMQLQIGQAYMTVTVSAASLEEFDHHTYYARPLYEKTDDERCVKNVFDFQLFRKCPSVSLNYEDYLRLMKATKETCRMSDIKSVFGISDFDGEITSRTGSLPTQVCLELYLSVIPKKNQGIVQVYYTMTIVIMSAIPNILD